MPVRYDYGFLHCLDSNYIEAHSQMWLKKVKRSSKYSQMSQKKCDTIRNLPRFCKFWGKEGGGEAKLNSLVARIFLVSRFLLPDWCRSRLSSSGNVFVRRNVHLCPKRLLFPKPLVSPLSFLDSIDFRPLPSHWSKTFLARGYFTSVDIIHCCLFLLFHCLLLCIFRSTELFYFVFCLLLLHFCLQGKSAGQLLGQNIRGPAPFFFFTTHICKTRWCPPKKILKCLFLLVGSSFFKLLFLNHISFLLHISWLDYIRLFFQIPSNVCWVKVVLS